MHDWTTRAATLVLAIGGLTTLVLAAALAQSGALRELHWSWMSAALGGALLAGAAWPSWRLPSIGAALLGKLSFLAAALASAQWPDGASSELALVLLLAVAGALVLRNTCEEARWNAGRALGTEP